MYESKDISLLLKFDRVMSVSSLMYESKFWIMGGKDEIKTASKRNLMSQKHDKI
jgi:hypothetical protein